MVDHQLQFSTYLSKNFDLLLKRELIGNNCISSHYKLDLFILVLNLRNIYLVLEQKDFVRTTLNWMILGLLVGLVSGTASAIFLIGLDWVSSTREASAWLIGFLPLAGFLIGYVYYHHGGQSDKGANLVLSELAKPQQPIPFIMAPLVFVGTLMTHLFGGSAGREGTAVQMGASLADSISRLVKLRQEDRHFMLIAGVAGGFASVFGTPLAGVIFAGEWMLTRKIDWKLLLPVLLTAYIAHWISAFGWQVIHTPFPEISIGQYSILDMLWVVPAGIVFGLAARLFAKTGHFFSDQFARRISYPPFRPLIGGVLIALLVWITDSTTYIGLGVPRILEAFESPLPWYDWIAKTGLTGLTLGSGFKGGEVTPLFFTGATLGNTLSNWIPLPLALMAAIGFVSVFAGSTNTPLTCTVMGMELFGYEAGIYFAIGCLTAYLASGRASIYSGQNLDNKLIFDLKSGIFERFISNFKK